uniref:Putative exonuclease n=1 Tax=viral metagenome TaxID=1070528 RepID=A0A6H1ZM53_9ZZZZ
MEIIDCQQGTDEWIAAKLGKVSSSHFSEVLAKGQGKTRNAYMLKLAAERLTGLPQEGYSNIKMDRGIEIEPQAREYYAKLYDCEVVQVGFCQLNEDVGTSPDGLIGDNGAIEIKCPDSTTHLANIITAKMPTIYVPQVQGQLWITGRKFCDFVSFDPRVQQRPFWSVRIERDEEYIKNLSESIWQFVSELRELIEKITGNVPF